ncbi:hypothetical protein [Nocardia sp. NPDC056100]|uniref:hypothetical protein n=1 Tax=Nocardia sp. NPDC056100 TaxID=3345712 RepID=UPI0035DCBD79
MGLSSRNDLLYAVAIHGRTPPISVETYLINGQDTLQLFAACALGGFAFRAGLDDADGPIDLLAADAIDVETALTIDNVVYSGVEIIRGDLVARAATIDNTRRVSVCAFSGPVPRLSWTRS